MLVKGLQYAAVLILLLLLILVRVFENYFYDPLQTYFEYDYLHNPLPEINKSKLLINLFLRYFINMVLSIPLLWIFFKDVKIIKFSVLFYSISFVILIALFMLLIQIDFEKHYLPSFYIRRFLIQPLFIFILLPAFYYQKVLNR